MEDSGRGHRLGLRAVRPQPEDACGKPAGAPDLPLAIRRCRALVAISDATRLELERRFPAARGRATVAHPAADPLFTPEPAAEDRQVLERHGIKPPFILVAGTLEPRKTFRA